MSSYSCHPMIKFKDLSPVQKIVTILFLFLVAFIVAGAIGYLIWSLGNSNSTKQPTNWEMGGKIGFLLLSLIPIAYVSSTIGSFLKNLLNLKLPRVLSQAIFMGCAFAVFNGVGILFLGIETNEFWLKVVRGFALGSFSGGIGEFLIQKTQKNLDVK
ncbi:MAG: hypothetical protein AAF383_15885 [Cyanobacteria bacterium P01_A01_bin.83]